MIIIKKLFGLFVLALASVLFATTAIAAPVVPVPGAQYQWQLSSVPSTTQINSLIPTVKYWDYDGFDASASTVSYIASKGGYSVCYVSAGSAENWRPDYSRFTAAVKGKSLDGWAGEKWVDTRSPLVRQIMADRAAMCASKGFNAIEWDNVDAYTNSPGFPLTAATQLDYNKYLATVTHNVGLAAVLKNDVDQVVELEPYFDFALNEQCNQYSECGIYTAFSSKGKAVWITEYQTLKSAWCTKAKANNWSLMKKNLSLNAARTLCP